MRNFQEWFSATELARVLGMPNTPQGVNKKARTNNYLKRNRDGIQGGAVEYHYSSLPEDVQRRLGFDPAARKTEINEVKEPPAPYNDDMVTVSKARLLTAITTLDEILDMTRKTMPAKARAQMVWMIYELLSEESANEKIINLVRMVA